MIYQQQALEITQALEKGKERHQSEQEVIIDRLLGSSKGANKPGNLGS